MKVWEQVRPFQPLPRRAPPDPPAARERRKENLTLGGKKAPARAEVSRANERRADVETAALSTSSARRASQEPWELYKDMSWKSPSTEWEAAPGAKKAAQRLETPAERPRKRFGLPIQTSDEGAALLSPSEMLAAGLSSVDGRVWSPKPTEGPRRKAKAKPRPGLVMPSEPTYASPRTRSRQKVKSTKQTEFDKVMDAVARLASGSPSPPPRPKRKVKAQTVRSKPEYLPRSGASSQRTRTPKARSARSTSSTEGLSKESWGDTLDESLRYSRDLISSPAPAPPPKKKAAGAKGNKNRKAQAESSDSDDFDENDFDLVSPVAGRSLTSHSVPGLRVTSRVPLAPTELHGPRPKPRSPKSQASPPPALPASSLPRRRRLPRPLASTGSAAKPPRSLSRCLVCATSSQHYQTTSGRAQKRRQDKSPPPSERRRRRRLLRQPDTCLHLRPLSRALLEHPSSSADLTMQPVPTRQERPHNRLSRKAPASGRAPRRPQPGRNRRASPSRTSACCSPTCVTGATPRRGRL